MKASQLIGYVEYWSGLFSFQELDYVIYEARRNQIRLIICLVNNFDNFGGKAQYVKWAQAAGANVMNSIDSFFYHPTIKGYYKDYVKVIEYTETSIAPAVYHSLCSYMRL